MTEKGERDAEYLGEQIVEFKDHLKVDVESIEVHSSTSTRAMRTAQRIAPCLGVLHMERPELGSLVSPATTGRTFGQILMADAEFARQFNLYRAGLFDSYQMRYIGAIAGPYEKRVLDVLRGMVERKADLFVVVAHRSTLTAALVGMARNAGHYPSGRSGFVPLRLGSISLASFDFQSGWELHFADMSAGELNKFGPLMVRRRR